MVPAVDIEPSAKSELPVLDFLMAPYFFPGNQSFPLQILKLHYVDHDQKAGLASLNKFWVVSASVGNVPALRIL